MSDLPNHDSIFGAVSGNVDLVLHSTPPQSALPTLDGLPVGISPQQAHVVASALSRHLCKTKSSAFSHGYDLQRALLGYANTDLPGSPALQITCATRDPATSLRRVGISVSDVKRAWQQQVDLDQAAAVLPGQLLLAIFDPPLWEAAWTLIADGPGVAVQRVEKFLRMEAERTIAPNRSRPEGGLISKAHLSTLSGALKRFMSVVVDLSARGHASGTLASWTAVPRIEVPDAPSAVTDRTAPPLTLLRTRWATLEAEIEELFGAPPADHLALVPTLNSRQQTRLFHRLRDSVAFGLLICFGPRRAAESRLLVADYQRDRKLADGTHGPAIVVTPLKGWAETDRSPKPIPQGLADLIDVYLAFLELRLGRPQPPDAPLLIPALTRPDSHWSLSAMSQWMSGKKTEGSTSKKAFLPRLASAHPQHDPYDGYGLHTIRDAVTQTIRGDIGKKWLIAHGLQSDAVFRVSISEATTEHMNFTFDAYGYAGAKKPQYRELLSGYGSHIMWSAVTTRSGARLMPDVARFTAVLHKRTGLEGELERLRQEERRASSNEPSTVTGATALLLALHRLNARKDVIADELRAVERELHALRHDRSEWVVVPDEVEKVPVINLDGVEREFFEGVSPLRREALRPVRPWLTVSELAWCSDNPTSTVRRWFSGRLPKSEKDWPWSPEDPPIDSSLGPKQRRALLAKMNLDRLFDTDLKRQRRAETLARWPEHWSEEDCLAPFRLDDKPAHSDATVPRLRTAS